MRSPRLSLPLAAMLSATLWSQTALSATLTTYYGPPAAANEWEEVVIPLTAESFDTDAATLRSVLSQVQLVRISFEMRDGDDAGGIDSVRLGSRNQSDFTTGADGWSSSGDGTMRWLVDGGASGGFLHVEDWASGDWHYAVMPAEWMGDWSDLEGSSLTFHVMTDHPNYAGHIEIQGGGDASRQLFLTADRYEVAPGAAVQMMLELGDGGHDGLVIDLDSSSQAFVVPESVVLTQGERSVRFNVDAVGDVGDEGTITAQASGWLASRVTLKVAEETVVVDEPDQGVCLAATELEEARQAGWDEGYRAGLAAAGGLTLPDAMEADFDGITGVLTIPSVLVGRERYQVRLIHVREEVDDFLFRLLDAEVIE